MRFVTNSKPLSKHFCNQIQPEFQAIFQAISKPNSKLVSRQNSINFQTSNIMHATLFEIILWIFLAILICKLHRLRRSAARASASAAPRSGSNTG